MAYNVANGKSTSNGIATATTGINAVYFTTTSGSTAILTYEDKASAPTDVIYIAEKTAPQGYEKNKGVYKVEFTAGTSTDGKGAVINKVTYYTNADYSSIQAMEGDG